MLWVCGFQFKDGSFCSPVGPWSEFIDFRIQKIPEYISYMGAMTVVSFLGPSVLHDWRPCPNICVHGPSSNWYLQPLPWWSFLFTTPLVGLIVSVLNEQPIRSRQTLITVFCNSLTFYATRIIYLPGFSLHPTTSLLYFVTFLSLIMGAYYAMYRNTGKAFSQVYYVLHVLVLESASVAFRAPVKFPILNQIQGRLMVGAFISGKIFNNHQNSSELTNILWLTALKMLLACVLGLALGASMVPVIQKDKRALTGRVIGWKAVRILNNCLEALGQMPIIASFILLFYLFAFVTGALYLFLNF